MTWVADANGNWYFDQTFNDSYDRTVIGTSITVNGVLHTDNKVTTGGGRDNITTGAGNDVISSGAGNDIIQAAGGNNTIYSGDGNDEIRSGSGYDNIDAGDGNDTIYDLGGSANISAGNGNDVVYVTQSPFLQNIKGDGGNDLIVLTLTESDDYRKDLPTFVSGGDGKDTLALDNARYIGFLGDFKNIDGTISFTYSDTLTSKLSSFSTTGIERIQLGGISPITTFSYFDFSEAGVIRKSYDLSVTLLGANSATDRNNKNSLFINDLFDGKTSDEIIDKYIEKGYLSRSVFFKYGAYTKENAVKLIWSNILGSEPPADNELYLSLVNGQQSIAEVIKFANGYVNSTQVDLVGTIGANGYVTCIGASLF